MEVLIPLYAVATAFISGRYVGAAGQRRFEALRDERARQVHGWFTTRLRWWALGYFGIFGGVELGTAVDPLSPLRLTSATVTLVGLALAMVFARLARPGIEAAYVERDLPPHESAFVARDRSARRSRRQGQLLRVVLVASMVAVGLSVLDGLTDAGWVTALLVVAWSFVVVALLTLGWAMAWVYGDEEPPAWVGTESHIAPAPAARANDIET